MTAARTTPWLLVHTKPKQEALAERGLRSRGLLAYCPRVIEPPAHRRAARGPVPLFPSYVFCKTDVEAGFAAATYCPGVNRIVRFGETFAVLQDADVDLLTARESGRGYLVIPPRPIVPGDVVRVEAGPLDGLEAVVDGLLPSQERVRLLLRVASGTWRAVLPLSDVRFTGNHRRCSA